MARGKKESDKKRDKVVKDNKNKSSDLKNNNVRTIIVVILLILFFLVVFMVSANSGKGEYSDEASSSVATSDVQSESASISEEEMGDLTEISIDDYLKLLKGDNYSIIYIGRPTCSHCTVQQPIMRYMVYKYGVVVNYLNTDNLDQDGINKLMKSDEYFSDGFGTPLILIVKSKEIVDKSEGETSIEDLEEMFRKYDLISEE